MSEPSDEALSDIREILQSHKRFQAAAAGIMKIDKYDGIKAAKALEKLDSVLREIIEEGDGTFLTQDLEEEFAP